MLSMMYFIISLFNHSLLNHSMLNHPILNSFLLRHGQDDEDEDEDEDEGEDRKTTSDTPSSGVRIKCIYTVRQGAR